MDEKTKVYLKKGYLLICNGLKVIKKKRHCCAVRLELNCDGKGRFVFWRGGLRWRINEPYASFNGFNDFCWILSRILK